MAITQEEKEYLLESVSKFFTTQPEFDIAVRISNSANDLREGIKHLSGLMPPGWDFISSASSFGVRTPEHILLMSNSDAARMYRQNQELMKIIQVQAHEIEIKNLALKEPEIAQAARLKAEELAKSQAEKVQRLENELEEAYAKIESKDNELIECLEKTNFFYNCGNQFSGEESNDYKDGL